MLVNSLDSNLQLTIKIGGNELCFLDLKLTLKKIKFKRRFTANQPIATYDVLYMSRQQSRLKKTKNTSTKNKTVSCSKYNPLGPTIKKTIQKHAHILGSCQIMQSKEIMVAYEREKKLKELLTRADLYNVVNHVDDVPCKKRCDSCTNFVIAKSSFECFPTKKITKLDGLPYMFPKM